MKPTPLDALRFLRNARLPLLLLFRELKLESAEAVAIVLYQLDDIAQVLGWLDLDPNDAPAIHAELAAYRQPEAKSAPNALGYIPPLASAHAAPWRPGPELWDLTVPPRASLVAQALRSGQRNQNPRGTCVAFATCKALEVLNDDGIALSPQFLYYHMKQNDGLGGQDGSFANTSLDHLEEVGVCDEALFPYQAVNYVAQGLHPGGPPPPEYATDDAQSRRTGANLLVAWGDNDEFDAARQSFAGWLDWLRSPPAPPRDAASRNRWRAVQFTKAALSGALGPSPRAVVGCFRWYESASQRAAATGRMIMPLPNDRTGERSGHAMAVVGYADDSSWAGGGYLIIQNSWGRDWPLQSEDGPALFRMSYAYATAYMSEAGVPIRPGEEAQLRLGVQSRASATNPSSSAPAAPRFCTSCGSALAAGARFCSGCGTPVGTSRAEPARPAAPTAPLSRLDEHKARLESNLAQHQARMQQVMDRLGTIGAPADSAPHASTRCIYCGSSSFGSCSNGPEKRHKHSTNGSTCAWCGSSSYGSCSNAPHRQHEHGPGKGCRYCGSSSYGSCSNSPSRRHEH
jgi:hypothetical protein